MPPSPASGDGEVVHIAGVDVQVGHYYRQRCSWCGATLLDYDLSRMGFQVMPDDPPDKEYRPGAWQPGALVAIAGEHGGGVPSFSMGRVIEHEDGEALPANACAQLDPELTV